MHYITILLLFGSVFAAADEPEQKKPATAKPRSAVESEGKPVSFWMDKKLEYTQSILRGLATGDLEDVADKGEQMRLLSRVEGWIRNRKPGYQAQFQAFQFANAEIVRNAKADNLDGAAMAFQQLTISCVSCHKMLRDLQ